MPWFPDVEISDTQLLDIFRKLKPGEHSLYVYEDSLGKVFPAHEGGTYFKVRDKMIAIVPEMRHV